MASSGQRVWADRGSYESYVGRWSRLIAKEFLSWLDVPSGSQWLDVGCGTGALSETILAIAHPSWIQGIDPSEGSLAHARARITDERVCFANGSASALPDGNPPYDAVISGLVLNFISDIDTAVAEMVRVVRPGGTVAAYVWDYAGEMQLIRYFWDSAVALNPAARDLDQGRRFPLCQPGPLAYLFRDAGLENVHTRAIEVPTVFRDFDDYWSTFLGGQFPGPEYAMSLNEEQRSALREHLRTRLPIAEDGSISLIARAWAVRGTRTETKA